MKKDYLKVMEIVVSAYTEERIQSYISKIEQEGITEHGFPRLAANIGILIAHGRKTDLRKYFETMMEFCITQIPQQNIPFINKGNDFSVREIVFAIVELEKSGIYDKETIQRWRDAMALIVPEKCYSVIAPTPPTAVNNWGAFNAVSEQARKWASIADTTPYIENQIESQLLSFDEAGMYRDPNEPMVYDLVTRNLMAVMLYLGYEGRWKQRLESIIESVADKEFLMQSVNGELPYGGRSNSFIHNEAHMAICFEYIASARKKKGDTVGASKAKAAANLALENIKLWLRQNPDHHIKNYYPTESKIGCEKYAYYDKYMVTVASFLYLAYLFCDDAIEPSNCPASDASAYSWTTTEHFHKLFLKSDSYFVEIDWNADPHYDASGIGRIQRRDAPSEICLSLPVSKKPSYSTGKENPTGLSICAGIKIDGKWAFALDKDAIYSIPTHHAASDNAHAKWECSIAQKHTIRQQCRVSSNGISISACSNAETAIMIPVFQFDGANRTKTSHSEKEISVVYRGWICRYTTNGKFEDIGQTCVNRNGEYQVFHAANDKSVEVKVTIDRLE